jgi:hypothetical protein
LERAEKKKLKNSKRTPIDTVKNLLPNTLTPVTGNNDNTPASNTVTVKKDNSFLTGVGKVGSGLFHIPKDVMSLLPPPYVTPDTPKDTLGIDKESKLTRKESDIDNNIEDSITGFNGVRIKGADSGVGGEKGGRKKRKKGGKKKSSVLI